MSVEHFALEALAGFCGIPQHQRTGDEDGGISAQDHADGDRHGELKHGRITQEQEHNHRSQSGRAGEERAAQGLADSLIHQLTDRAGTTALNGFTDTVKDHDGVIDRVTGDGQHGSDVDQAQFLAEQHAQSGHHEDVMEEGHDGTQSEGEFKARHQVNKDTDQGHGEGDQRSLG